MRALGRINLLVSGLFLVVTLISLFILLRQAGDDVRRELAAGQAVVDFLAADLRRDPHNLSPQLLKGLRHVRAVWLEDAPEQARQPEWPDAWLHRWLSLPPEGVELIRFADGRALQLSADPEDELDEVWDSLWQLLGVYGFAWLLSLLVIRWAVRRGLGVLQELLDGLQGISRGELATRLTGHPLPEAQLLAAHFNRMATALQEAQGANQQLSQALLRLQEQERTRLAQALHDDLGQYLAGIRAQACLLGVQAESPQLVRSSARALEGNCQHLQEGFRRLVRDLYPVMLDHLPLEQALQQLVEQWQQAQGIACRLSMHGALAGLGQERKLHLYRLLQEALTNVARHAGASRVQIRLRRRGTQLCLVLRDDGHGCASGPPGIGLRSMHERARCLGGALYYRGRPGRGWVLGLSLPLQGVPDEDSAG